MQVNNVNAVCEYQSRLLHTKNIIFLSFIKILPLHLKQFLISECHHDSFGEVAVVVAWAHKVNHGPVITTLYAVDLTEVRWSNNRRNTVISPKWNGPILVVKILQLNILLRACSTQGKDRRPITLPCPIGIGWLYTYSMCGTLLSVCLWCPPGLGQAGGLYSQLPTYYIVTGSS